MTLDLAHTNIVFDSASHTYWDESGQVLYGITDLIHKVIGLGVYPESNEYVKNVAIPKAASRGTAVHQAIETYDTLGIADPIQYVIARYGYANGGDASFVEEEWNVLPQLERYIANQLGFKNIANEYCVTDGKRFCSKIDNVWVKEDTDEIWLFDTKTTNLDTYPKCGYGMQQYFPDSVSALKDYLSWQLSIYAELFEAMNPTLKVSGLGCNWLREDDSALWIIDRKPKEMVWELLSADVVDDENGINYVYATPPGFISQQESLVSSPKETNLVSAKVIDYVSNLLKVADDTRIKLDEMKIALKEQMQLHGLSKWDAGEFSISLSEETTFEHFDVKQFKLEHPDLYAQYTTDKPKSATLRIKLKK